MARRSRTHRLAPVGLALLLALGAACGDGSEGASGGTGADADAPERIVSLSPAATEIIYAVGAGDQVVAVDDFSNYPEDAPMTDLSGYTPNVEAILDHDPDLVVLSADTNDVVAGLEAAGVEVLLTPSAATLDEAWQQFIAVGEATGHADEAAEVLDDLKGQMDELAASVPKHDEPLTYYFELSRDFYSVSSNTFIGEVLAMAGLKSIADAADDGSGYPQLTAEAILEADPDVIFLADTKFDGGETIESAGARPGWDQLTAVQDGNVVELDDDIASRWGPRVVDLLQAVVDATAKVPA